MYTRTYIHIHTHMGDKQNNQVDILHYTLI